MKTRVNIKQLVALALLSTLGASQAETLERGPYLQNGAVDGATVMWRTDSAVAGKVWYGTTQGSLTQSVTGDSATDHSIRITDLTPGTKYFYKIGNDAGGVLAGDDADHYWVTNPVVGSTDSVRIWAIGDSGTKNDDARAVRDAYQEHAGDTGKADVWLMLGDNAYSTGTDTEYQAAVFDNMYEDVLRNTMLWSTLGNHDAGNRNTYLDIFNLPKSAEGGGSASGSELYYSFDYGNIHFICLDSETATISGDADSAMYTWLNNDLAATSQEWIIAFFHHPPYTKGSHDSDNDGDSDGRLKFMREIALPLLEAGGVDLVLSGHSHCYERSKFINGHYGSSSTFDADTHVVQSGNGDSDGSYQKTGLDGAIYIVAGSSGKISRLRGQHAAMESSLSKLGSVVIDVSDKQMDVSFIRQHTTPVVVDDKFTIIHGVASPSAPAFTYNPHRASDGLTDTAYIGDLSAAANDANGDVITFAKVSGPAWLSVASDGTLSGTPVLADLGLNDFTVSATDVDGSTNASLEILVREPSKPIVHWRFDESSGSVAGDSSGNGYDGTLQDMDDQDWLTGKVGNALDFDGADDWVLSSYADSFSTDHTWSGWIKTTGNGTIIAKGPQTGGWAQGGKCIYLSSGKVRYDVGWVGYVQAPVAVNDGEWHHVAVTVEFETSGTNDTATLYIDGQVAASKNDWNVNTYNDSGLVLKVGAAGDNFGGYFSGLMDEVHVYGQVLSQTEIASDMASSNHFQQWAYDQDTAGSVNGDHNNNAIPNLIEFTLGQATIPQVRLDHTIKLTITKESLDDGYSCDLLYSLDLLNWNTATANSPNIKLLSTTTDIDNGNQEVTYELDDSAPRIFYKFKVQ
jgi:hypothetical protein